MATVKDYNENPPTKLTELSLTPMLHYVQGLGESDVKWYGIICEKYEDKEKKQGINITEVRWHFAARYFPDLIKTKKKPAASFADELEKALKNIK